MYIWTRPSVILQQLAAPGAGVQPATLIPKHTLLRDGSPCTRVSAVLFRNVMRYGASASVRALHWLKGHFRGKANGGGGARTGGGGGEGGGDDDDGCGEGGEGAGGGGFFPFFPFFGFGGGGPSWPGGGRGGRGGEGVGG